MPRSAETLANLLASGKDSESTIFGPAQFAHAVLGGVIRNRDPLFHIMKVFLMRTFCREARKQLIFLIGGQLVKAASETPLRLAFEYIQRRGKLLLVLC